MEKQYEKHASDFGCGEVLACVTVDAGHFSVGDQFWYVKIGAPKSGSSWSGLFWRSVLGEWMVCQFLWGAL